MFVSGQKNHPKKDFRLPQSRVKWIGHRWTLLVYKRKFEIISIWHVLIPFHLGLYNSRSRSWAWAFSALAQKSGSGFIAHAHGEREREMLPPRWALMSVSCTLWLQFMRKQIFAPATEGQYVIEHWESESEPSFAWNTLDQAETNENRVFEKVVSDRNFDAANSNLTTVLLKILLAS
jgi:hypothetical protein